MQYFAGELLPYFGIKGKVEAVIYAMANKFLDSMDMNKIREVIRMTKLGQMLRDEGIALGKELGREQGKLDMVKKLLVENLLEPEQIARITDLPLETILQMKQED